jgi:hypothetical protein
MRVRAIARASFDVFDANVAYQFEQTGNEFAVFGDLGQRRVFLRSLFDDNFRIVRFCEVCAVGVPLDQKLCEFCDEGRKGREAYNAKRA